MNSRFRRSAFLRFTSTMSSIMEKYNFPFEDDMVVSIRSLTYVTAEGPKVWGEEELTSTRNIDSSQNIVPFQENTEIERQLASDSENENSEEYQKKDTSPVCYYGTPAKNKNQVKMDILLEEGDYFGPKSRPKKDTSPVCYYGTPAKNKNQVKMDILLEEGDYFGPKSRPKKDTSPVCYYGTPAKNKNQVKMDILLEEGDYFGPKSRPKKDTSPVCYYGTPAKNKNQVKMDILLEEGDYFGPKSRPKKDTSPVCYYGTPAKNKNQVKMDILLEEGDYFGPKSRPKKDTSPVCYYGTPAKNKNQVKMDILLEEGDYFGPKSRPKKDTSPVCYYGTPAKNKNQVKMDILLEEGDYFGPKSRPKKDTSPVCYYGTPAKNKNQVKMDILLEEGDYFGPKSRPVTRPKAKSVYQWSPLQKLGGQSLSVGHHDVVLRKQTESINGHPASTSLQLSDSMTIVPENQSLGGGNETVCRSFLEMYESADEHCSWNNLTIGDLYPGMVKSLSRLLHKASPKASYYSSIKRYRYGYWCPKKAKLNTSTDRVRKSRQLKQKSSLTIREDDSNGYQLSMANNGQISPLYDGNREMQCSVNKVTEVVSSIDCNPDSVEMDASGIVEDHSYTENVGLNGMETTIFPRDLSTEETFLVRAATYIPSLSNFGRKAQTFEEYSSKSSPVKTSNRLPGNHEIKTFNKAVSLQRSHSFSSRPVNLSPIKSHQKCDDAFDKMYKELCSKMQKPFKGSTMCTSPRKSPELCKFGFKSLSSNFNQKRENMIEKYDQKLCSEGLPKIPAFMRAANLRKYEGIPVSNTVNALVNSPVRTLPSVARIKRAANVCIEDSPTSPLKRLKISENSPYRISQKLPYWKNNLLKTDKTYTLHTPNGNSWTSNMDSGSVKSSKHTFLSVPSTCIKESRITSVDGNTLTFVQSSDSLRKPSLVSRKLSYQDGGIRRRNVYVEEPLSEDYES